MGYKNGEKILPDELMKQIQQYVDGEIIYIPRKTEERFSWGEHTGTKEIMENRNREIYLKYKEGHRVVDLVKEYFISKQGIYKIISRQKRA